MYQPATTTQKPSGKHLQRSEASKEVPTVLLSQAKADAEIEACAKIVSALRFIDQERKLDVVATALALLHIKIRPDNVGAHVK